MYHRRDENVPSSFLTKHVKPLEDLHYDLFGPFSKGLGGHYYATHVIKSWSWNSEVFFLKLKFALGSIILSCIATIESALTSHVYRVRGLRCKISSDSMSLKILSHCRRLGIELKPLPPYLASSNGLIERLVQHSSTCVWEMMFGWTLPQTLWAKSLYHGKWLRNLFPSSRMQGTTSPALRAN